MTQFQWYLFILLGKPDIWIVNQTLLPWHSVIKAPSNQIPTTKMQMSLFYRTIYGHFHHMFAILWWFHYLILFRILISALQSILLLMPKITPSILKEDKTPSAINKTGTQQRLALSLWPKRQRIFSPFSPKTIVIFHWQKCVSRMFNTGSIWPFSHR